MANLDIHDYILNNLHKPESYGQILFETAAWTYTEQLNFFFFLLNNKTPEAWLDSMVIDKVSYRFLRKELVRRIYDVLYGPGAYHLEITHIHSENGTVGIMGDVAVKWGPRESRINSAGNGTFGDGALSYGNALKAAQLDMLRKGLYNLGLFADINDHSEEALPVEPSTKPSQSVYESSLTTLEKRIVAGEADRPQVAKAVKILREDARFPHLIERALKLLSVFDDPKSNPKTATSTGTRTPAQRAAKTTKARKG